ncbi:MAG: hypothetical protein FWH57_07390 [Oscillospiraceae bacterium]|nr:hypothetical protein [Oscillospiraceae bacterium]
MIYEDWKENFVDDAGKSGIIAIGEGMQRKISNAGAFQHLSEPMQLRHVRRVAEKYGIDLQDTHVRIERDGNLVNQGYFGVANNQYRDKGRIHLYPDAFSSEEELAKTLYHEKIHLEQFIEFGYENVVNERERFENIADELEELFWKERGKK